MQLPTERLLYLNRTALLPTLRKTVYRYREKYLAWGLSPLPIIPSF